MVVPVEMVAIIRELLARHSTSLQHPETKTDP
jgi:hypothetical protein